MMTMIATFRTGAAARGGRRYQSRHLTAQACKEKMKERKDGYSYTRLCLSWALAFNETVWKKIFPLIINLQCSTIFEAKELLSMRHMVFMTMCIHACVTKQGVLEKNSRLFVKGNNQHPQICK